MRIKYGWKTNDCKVGKELNCLGFKNFFRALKQVKQDYKFCKKMKYKFLWR